MKQTTREKLQAMLETPPVDVVIPEGSSFVAEDFETFILGKIKLDAQIKCKCE